MHTCPPQYNADDYELGELEKLDQKGVLAALRAKGAPMRMAAGPASSGAAGDVTAAATALAAPAVAGSPMAGDLEAAEVDAMMAAEGLVGSSPLSAQGGAPRSPLTARNNVPA
jgi:hypothetical protein